MCFVHQGSLVSRGKTGWVVRENDSTGSVIGELSSERVRYRQCALAEPESAGLAQVVGERFVVFDHPQPGPHLSGLLVFSGL